MSRIPALVEAARGGDPRALARLITLVENDDEGLPETLQELAYRNGMTIGRDPHFHSDVDRLIKSLENYFASLPAQAEPPPAPAAHVATPVPTAQPEQVDAVAQHKPQPPPVAATTSAAAGQSPAQPAQPAQSPRPADSARHVAREPAPAVAAGPPVPAVVQSVRSEWLIEPGKRFRIFLLFLLAHVLLAFASFYTFRSILLPALYPHILVILLNSILGGLALGGAQAILLRRYLPSARSWLLLTAAAAAIVGLVAALLGAPMEYMFSYRGAALPPLFALLRWMLIGLSQWWLLRKVVQSAGLWLAASVGGAVVLALIQTAVPAFGYNFILYPLCVGMTIGAAQGLTLLYFKRDTGALAQS